MLTRSKDVSAQVAMIREAGRLQNLKRGERIEIRLRYVEAQEAIERILVDVLGYMTEDQFTEAVFMSADLQLDEEQAEQDQLEYEYQLKHNI